MVVPSIVKRRTVSPIFPSFFTLFNLCLPFYLTKNNYLHREAAYVLSCCPLLGVSPYFLQFVLPKSLHRAATYGLSCYPLRFYLIFSIYFLQFILPFCTKKKSLHRVEAYGLSWYPLRLHLLCRFRWAFGQPADARPDRQNGKTFSLV